uniref:Cytochrome P450, family 1, subfamily D, polypeptide 1 n=3 Tax=Nothobranchius furzeri TaxID=105023 RepID=A0A8C6PF94_NOTFU
MHKLLICFILYFSLFILNEDNTHRESGQLRFPLQWDVTTVSNSARSKLLLLRVSVSCLLKFLQRRYTGPCLAHYPGSRPKQSPSLLTIPFSLSSSMGLVLSANLPVMDDPCVSVSSVTSALCLFTVILMAIRVQQKHRLFFHSHSDSQLEFLYPPGPTPWPLVGNLLQMGDQMHLSLTRLGHQYGDVFKMSLGSLPVVVLSGFSTIRQALVRQGEDFAGRPELFTFSAVANGTSMTFSEKYGPTWLLHKKLCKNALRSFSQAEPRASGATCLLEEHICAEAAEMVEMIKMQADCETIGVDPSISLLTSVANVVCALCFGRRYDHNDEEFLTIININNEVLKLFAAGNLADFFPVFRYFPSPSLRKLVLYIRRMNGFMERRIEEHINTFDKNCMRDITDALIQLCEDREESKETSQLSDSQIIHTVIDIFGAGFDTIFAGLQWSLFYLIKFPDIQDKIHQEIDDHMSSARLPRFSDNPKMPFTEAFIYEVFRHSSYVPFTIPHCTTRDTILNGYLIPKDTCVFVNQYGANHDVDLWGDPEKFRPNRFLGASGQLNKELTEKVLIFGLGKRRCLGDGFARLEMFVFLTTLLHGLKIENVPGQELDLCTEFGLTMKPRPYRITISPRF